MLKTTGTTWEDYYRYCAEQSGSGNQIPTTDSLLIRTAGTAVPANAGNGLFFDNMNIYTPSTLLVDDNGVQCPTASFTSINAAIAAASTDDIIQVCAGSYNEDVAVNKSVKLRGAGSATTTVSGPIGGSDGATFHILASNVEVSGFTITRDGNNLAQWNDPNLNSAGIAIQGQAITGSVIHDNVITGMRTAIDINNSNGHINSQQCDPAESYGTDLP